MLVQFTQVPDLAERRLLADSARVVLLDHVAERAFFAAVPADLARVAALVGDVRRRIRAIDVIRADDKAASWLLANRVPAHARQPDGRLELIVEFFGDVPPTAQEQVLAAHAGQIVARIEPLNGWHVLLAESRLRPLTGEDAVKWIVEYPPPPADDNDGVRSATGVNADAVLAPTAYNLSGAGVTVAQWEGTTASQTHADFAGRITLADPPVLVWTRTYTHDETVTVNGQFDNGEVIYSDIDDSRAVSPQDARITALAGCAACGAGTTVAPGDPDVGRPLAVFTLQELFLDNPPADFLFTVGETIYRDTDNSCTTTPTCVVTVGDARLTAGTVVAAGDPDLGQALSWFPSNPHYHSTHVAGTVMGNGAQSAANLGTANQWKGVAPGASLRSYDATNRFAEYTNAVTGGATISTNSWGTTHCHQVIAPADCYDAESSFWDGVISGRRSDGTPSGLPARILIVGSAGNAGTPERHAENVIVNGQYDNGEAIYLDADDNGAVSVGDAMRLGPAQPAGTALVNFTLSEMHSENTGQGTYNLNENIYLDADATRTVTAGDTRITAAAPLVAGLVATGDGDIATALRRFRLWGNVRIPNSAKNSIEVANITSDDMRLATTSSRGPTDDGRTKPDLAGPGDESGGDGGVKSTFPRNLYWVITGTSMATPAVSGTAAVLTQWYKSACVPAGPAPEVLRALLIHGAQDLTAIPSVGVFPGPDFAFGFGRTRVKEAVDLVPHHLSATATAMGNTDVTVTLGRTQPLRVTLTWSDPAWAEIAAASPATGMLQNDLDLIVIGPDGTQYTPWLLNGANPFAAATRASFLTGMAIPVTAQDKRNTVEQVQVDDAIPGVWTIRVSATTLNLPPQSYTLVSEALPPQIGPCATAPAADVWMRDNDTDVGTVPSTGYMWLGPDLWNRLAPDGGIDHQNPEYGQVNHLYANVRNASTVPVAVTTVEVWVGSAALGLIWPDNFAYAGRFTIPNLGPGEVRQVGPLEWNPPSPAPSSHFCLYMRVLSPQDPITYAEGAGIWNNAMNSNNIAYRNITVVDLASSRSVTFLARNAEPRDSTVDVVITVPAELLSEGQVELRLSDELDRRWPAQRRQVPGLVSLEARYRVVRGPTGAPRDTAQTPEPERVWRGPYRVTGREVVLRGLQLKRGESGRMSLTFSSTRRTPTTYQVDVMQQVNGRPTGGIRFVVRTGREGR